MLAYYVIAVILYFLFGYFFLPDEICGTGLYFLGSLIFPFALLIVLYAFGRLLEKDYSLNENVPPSKFSTPPKVSPSTKALVESALSDIPSSISVEEEISLSEQADSPEPVAPRQPTIDEILCSADFLDGSSFEKWCADLLKKAGFADVNLTKASGDQGVDITAIKDDIRYAFQCKCYSSDLGNHPVQEVYAGKSLYNCHVGVVMTNRYFTLGAKELAKATGTLLWDRDKIKSIIRTFYIEEYAPLTVGPSLFEKDPSSYWD